MIVGPVCAHFEFRFARPKSHFTGRGELKVTAPIYHCSRPDLSKLVRATEEELTGRGIEDDARISVIACSKTYCSDPREAGVTITVAPLPFTIRERSKEAHLVTRTLSH